MLKSLTILILGTVVLSALFTPPVYAGLLYLWPDLPWPFSRVFDRVALAFAILLIYYRRKDFALGELAQMFKAKKGVSRVKLVSYGLMLSLVSSLLFLPLFVDGSTLVWKDRSFDSYVFRILKVLPAALLISLIEESFFRLLLFNNLKKCLGLVGGVLICSTLYALAHSVSPAKSFVFESYSLGIGFTYLGEVFSRLTLPGVSYAMIGLFLVGVILCCIIQYTRSIYLCIGLHAGWVMAVKMSSFSTSFAPGYELALGIGRRYFLVAQPTVWLSLFVVGTLVYFTNRAYARQ